MPRRILLVDEQALIRKGLCSVLQENGFEVVGEAATCRAAVKLMGELKPSIVIVSAELPDGTGPDCIAEMIGINQKMKCICVMSSLDGVVRAIQAGAQAVVLRDSLEEIIRAVYACCSGGSYLCSRTAARAMFFVQNGEEPCPITVLTHREKQLLCMFAEGKQCKEAAAALDLEVSTVRTYRKNMMRKLNVHSAAELTGIAIRHKMVPASAA